MNEIGPGVHHWKTVHPRIQVEVSSYYVEPSATLIDPLVPPEGVEWFRSREIPRRIVLTNRHHYRRSAELQAEFGCPVLCSELGLHEFEGGPEVEGFAFGDVLTDGVTAYEVDAICPDESALHIDAGDGFLAIADGIVNYDGLAFVSDGLLGDDPEDVKQGLRESYRRLLALDFEGLLFAHGDPIATGGKHALREFVAQH